MQLVALIKKHGFAWLDFCLKLGSCFFLLSACENATPIVSQNLLKDFNIRSSALYQLSKVPFSALPGWKAGRQNELIPVFLKSCEKTKRQQPNKKVGKLAKMGLVKDWIKICKIAAKIDFTNIIKARYFFETNFQPYAYGDRWQSSGLFTGYYEPELFGSFQPNSRYRFPLFSLPKDIITSNVGDFDPKFKGNNIFGRLTNNRYIPYFTRRQIEEGALNGRQLEILWVDDEVDAFFLHIQGSGRIMLSDGTFVRLGFSGRNGHRYTSVGRELVGMGVMSLDKVTMPSIRDWMEANPLLARKVMNKNKSYIFFRVLNNDGPIGSHGVVLTPGRSLAIDPEYTPYGIPVWLDTMLPTGKPKERLRRLFVTQDTGAAIKGIVRGDVFWGSGSEAARKAGIMKSQGNFFLLLPKPIEIN